MWVKICANTNLEDALRAAELGADAVGFVFAPSKRQVTAAQVRAITEQMPAEVELVGVFPAGDVEGTVAAVREAGLTAVQMHGGVNLETAERLRERLGDGIALIPVVPWTIGEDEASEREVRAQLEALAASGVHDRVLGDRVLIDAKVGAASGGLGVRFDWARARGVVKEFPGLRVIVAGGLRPENVAEAVEIFAPYGVDVASGVEATPGRKDFEKLKAFIENARRAFAQPGVQSL
jgi:phosphoribosylanthranilate isomerase